MSENDNGYFTNAQWEQINGLVDAALAEHLEGHHLPVPPPVVNAPPPEIPPVEVPVDGHEAKQEQAFKAGPPLNRDYQPKEDAETLWWSFEYPNVASAQPLIVSDIEFIRASYARNTIGVLDKRIVDLEKQLAAVSAQRDSLHGRNDVQRETITTYQDQIRAALKALPNL